MADPSNKHWSFDIAVGQSLDSRYRANTNVGGTVSYAAGKRIALSSGIYYNEFGGTKDFNKGVIASSEGKTLSSTEAKMSGVEVPVELSYRIGSKISIKTGLSAFAITSQKQTLTFHELKEVATSYIDNNGELQQVSSLVNEESTIAVAGAKLDKTKTLGVYNLSLEFEQRLPGNKRIVVEPYIKLPLSTYSSQEISLKQTGLRIRLRF